MTQARAFGLSLRITLEATDIVGALLGIALVIAAIVGGYLMEHGNILDYSSRPSW